MAAAPDDLYEQLEIDLCLTRLRHIEARSRLRVADDPHDRAVEAECRALLDVILDLLIELKGRWTERRPAFRSSAG